MAVSGNSGLYACFHPECAGGCGVGSACVFTDGGMRQTACAAGRCHGDADCSAGSVCVVDPREPPPTGVGACIEIHNVCADCRGAPCYANPISYPGRSALTGVVNCVSALQSCNAAAGCVTGSDGVRQSCVLVPDGNTLCIHKRKAK